MAASRFDAENPQILRVKKGRQLASLTAGTEVTAKTDGRIGFGSYARHYFSGLEPTCVGTRLARLLLQLTTRIRKVET
jgi:hypothetical protein